jgi:hypothetical protein
LFNSTASEATLVVILDEILTGLAELAKRTEGQPQPVTAPAILAASATASQNKEIRIEDIEAWHKGGKEHWPRTSLSQFTTIVRMVEKFYKAA